LKLSLKDSFDHKHGVSKDGLHTYGYLAHYQSSTKLPKEDEISKKIDLIATPNSAYGSIVKTKYGQVYVPSV
jgi:hypothetical protein